MENMLRSWRKFDATLSEDRHLCSVAAAMIGGAVIGGVATASSASKAADAQSESSAAMAGAAAASDRISKEIADADRAENARQYDLNKEVSDKVVASQLAQMDENTRQGRDYYDYMVSRQRPVEEALNKDAMEAGSEADQEAAAGQAAADVRQGTTAAQQQIFRQGLRYGFSPERMGEIAKNSAMSEGLAVASAMNGAREKAKNTGYAKKLDVAGIYRGLAGASQGAYGLALNAGNSAVNNRMRPGMALTSANQGANATRMGGRSLLQSGLSNVLGANTSIYRDAAQNQADMTSAIVGAGTNYALNM